MIGTITIRISIPSSRTHVSLEQAQSYHPTLVARPHSHSSCADYRDREVIATTESEAVIKRFEQSERREECWGGRGMTLNGIMDTLRASGLDV